METQAENNNSEGFYNKFKREVSNSLNKIPLTTRFFFILCTTLFLIEKTKPIYLSSVCFSPKLLSDDTFNNIHKMIISNYFHKDIFHILFNMLTFIPFSSMLERSKFGSLYLFYLIIVFSILIPMMVFVLSFISYSLDLSVSYYHCSVGLSAIVFSLLEIHFYQLDNQLVSFYGLTKIPAKLYPWAILIITDFILPGSSFIGHLSGILVGLLYVKGYLEYFIISNNKFLEIELSNRFSYITAMDGYISNSHYSSTSSFVNLNSPRNLDGTFTRIKQYFNFNNSGGRQLGTVHSNQQEGNKIDIEIDSSGSNISNQIQRQPTPPLKYSPLIDMSQNDD